MVNLFYFTKNEMIILIKMNDDCCVYYFVNNIYILYYIN